MHSVKEEILQFFRDAVAMHFTPADIIKVAWLVFMFYWLISALRVNKMKRAEPIAQRLAYLLPIALAIFLLYRFAPADFLVRRFVPRRYWIGMLGASLTVAGVALAIWARSHIGRYWSASVALREDHELIRTGPYSRIRHPIYSGALLALAGTCLALGDYRAIVLFAAILTGFTLKARKEEALLAGEFGSAFDEHRNHTGFFLPKFS